MVRLRDWPANVVPRQDSDITQAVALLCRRGHWNGADQRTLERLLAAWFVEGWHVEAILHALDYQPDGSSQSRRSDRESPSDFVKARLTHWFDDDPNAASPHAKLPPPKPGLEVDEYLEIVRQRRQREGNRPRGSLSARGQQAREQAVGRAARVREDPVVRRREEDARIRSALDSLLVPGARPIPVRADSEPGSRSASARGIAQYADRRSAIRASPRVRSCLEQLAAGGTATPEQLQVLRGALLEAQQNAGLSSLTSAREDDSMSDEMRRILEFVERAVDSNTSVDAVLAMLES